MLYFASVSVEHTMLYQGRRKRGGGFEPPARNNFYLYEQNTQKN